VRQLRLRNKLGSATIDTRVARFFLKQHTKTGKIYQITIAYVYQMATKYTKWPQNIPNGHKIYQMATKYTKWPYNITTYFIARPSKKFTQIGIFGLKICHLATLIDT
jgi:hypothetical protein